MKAWVGIDAAGREFLVRTGRGTVTAVAWTPRGLHVEIDCTPAAPRPRSVRYFVSGLWPASVDIDDALRTGGVANWTIEWHRLDDVPAGIPVLSLNLSTDATAWVVNLTPVSSPAFVEGAR